MPGNTITTSGSFPWCTPGQWNRRRLIGQAPAHRNRQAAKVARRRATRRCRQAHRAAAVPSAFKPRRRSRSDAVRPAPACHRAAVDRDAGARRGGRHRRRRWPRWRRCARADTEVIVVDGGSRDGTLALAAAAGRPGARGAARPRAPDERRRRARRAATCCCSCTPTRGCPTAPTRRSLQRWLAGRAAGAASTCASTAARRCCALVGALHEPALALDRHRHRRPGDLRAARPRSSALGGFPDQPLMEDIELSRRLRAVSAPGLPARARAHLGPALGAARRRGARSC